MHPVNYLMKYFHLENVEYAKDLSITIDSHLKCHQHCSLVISKVNRVLDIIAKSFEFLNEMFLRIHATMVCPVLEYGNQIWELHFKRDQIAMERVQHQATRLLKSLQHRTYHVHLIHLKLSSLGTHSWRRSIWNDLPY